MPTTLTNVACDDAKLQCQELLAQTLDNQRYRKSDNVPTKFSTRILEEPDSISGTALNLCGVLHSTLKNDANYDAKLQCQGLSARTLGNLILRFSSRVGKCRAQSLKMIIFWYSGIPVECANEIGFLTTFIPDIPPPLTNDNIENVDVLVHRSVLVETCHFKLVTSVGGDWYEKIVSLNSKSLSMKRIERTLMQLCLSSIHGTCAFRREVANMMIDELQEIQGILFCNKERFEAKFVREEERWELDQKPLTDYGRQDEIEQIQTLMWRRKQLQIDLQQLDDELHPRHHATHAIRQNHRGEAFAQGNMHSLKTMGVIDSNPFGGYGVHESINERQNYELLCQTAIPTDIMGSPATATSAATSATVAHGAGMDHESPVTKELRKRRQNFRF